MNSSKTILTIILLSIAPALTRAQQSNNFSKEIKILEKYFNDEIKKRDIPGMSVGFMKDGFVWTAGFGYADVENQVPARANSSYRLASICKPMVAVAIMQLAEKGKLDLDDRVQKYVPYFPEKEYPVTIRQLLGHLGGITHYREQWEGHIKEYKDTRESIEIFAEYDLIAEPGTRYSYSSYGYNLLGAVIEGASKQSFYNYMQEHIWDPLKMDQTTKVSAAEMIPNRVEGYSRSDNEIVRGEFIDFSSRFGGGGVRSTVTDMLKFADGMISAKILSRESIQLMTTTMYTKEGRATGYGMGWSADPVNGHFAFSHGGGQIGTGTYLKIFPGEELAIAICCNVDYEFVNIDRIYQLIMDENYRLYTYNEDKSKRAVKLGMWQVFNHGASYFDKYGQMLSDNVQEIAEAFAYFNKHVNLAALDTAYDLHYGKITRGIDKAEQVKFVTVGSYIAEMLAVIYGEEQFDQFHRIREIPFFSKYIELYQATEGFPQEYRFNREFEELINAWEQDWKVVFTDEIRRLDIASAPDLKATGALLKKSFKDRDIYPDYSSEMYYDMVRFYFQRDQKKEALEVARLALDLYPVSALPYGMLIETHLWFGETEQAKEWYEKGKETASFNTSDDYMVGRIRNAAVLLAEHNHLDRAFKAMYLALELEPDNSELYDNMGELYLKRAREYFSKALEKDASRQHSREMIKKLEDM